MGDRSHIEVALLVIAGLIDGHERRAEAMAPLTAAVTAAVTELDPAGTRDTSPTWWQQLSPYVRLDALDRLRLAHDNLLVLEVQAGEIVMGLRSMLAPHIQPVRYTYRDDHRRLCDLAGRRAVHLEQLRLAERRLAGRLQPGTRTDLSAARRAFGAEEGRGARQRARLGALLAEPASAAS